MAVLKKNSTPKANSSLPSSFHPPYFQMISEAITTMKDRTGSSQPAIAKFIEENYAKLLPSNFRKILSIQLKRFVNSEKLVKVKNSYKISATDKVKKPSNLAKEKNTQKKNPANTTVTNANNSSDSKKGVAQNLEVKAKKTKRLSEVKTPENLKKNKTMVKKVSAGAEKMTKSKKTATPMKRKVGSKPVKTGSRPPLKKAKN